jgi:hypothetical protein
MNNNDFAAYYQVYDNQPQTSRILNTFRSIYPNTHIRLLCDSGSDHSELAKTHGCEYVHSPYHMGLWGHNHQDVVSGDHCYGWDKEEAIEHINRWYSFAKSIDTTYMMMMEDDIYVTSEIKIINLEFPFTQVTPGNQLCDATREFCKKFNPNHTLDKYGCCGGHFLNRELYIECVDKTMSFIWDNYDHLLSIERHIGWPDTLHNLVFNLCGYTGIENLDYSEGLSNPHNTSIFHDHSGREHKWNTIYSKIRK